MTEELLLEKSQELELTSQERKVNSFEYKDFLNKHLAQKENIDKELKQKILDNDFSCSEEKLAITLPNLYLDLAIASKNVNDYAKIALNQLENNIIEKNQYPNSERSLYFFNNFMNKGALENPEIAPTYTDFLLATKTFCNMPINQDYVNGLLFYEKYMPDCFKKISSDYWDYKNGEISLSTYQDALINDILEIKKTFNLTPEETATLFAGNLHFGEIEELSIFFKFKPLFDANEISRNEFDRILAITCNFYSIEHFDYNSSPISNSELMRVAIEEKFPYTVMYMKDYFNYLELNRNLYRKAEALVDKISDRRSFDFELRQNSRNFIYNINDKIKDDVDNGLNILIHSLENIDNIKYEPYVISQYLVTPPSAYIRDCPEFFAVLHSSFPEISNYIKNSLQSTKSNATIRSFLRAKTKGEKWMNSYSQLFLENGGDIEVIDTIAKLER